MKILMIVDWEISHRKEDVRSMQSANIVVPEIPYWFFKYWALKDVQIDVVGRKKTT